MDIGDLHYKKLGWFDKNWRNLIIVTEYDEQVHSLPWKLNLCTQA